MFGSFLPPPFPPSDLSQADVIMLVGKIETAHMTTPEHRDYSTASYANFFFFKVGLRFELRVWHLEPHLQAILL
jgi:hypothetical protein